MSQKYTEKLIKNKLLQVGVNIPFASSAKVKSCLFGNSFGNVDFGAKTSHAHIGWIRLNYDSTSTTQPIENKE